MSLPSSYSIVLVMEQRVFFRVVLFVGRDGVKPRAGHNRHAVDAIVGKDKQLDAHLSKADVSSPDARSNGDCRCVQRNAPFRRLRGRRQHQDRCGQGRLIPELWPMSGRFPRKRCSHPFLYDVRHALCCAATYGKAIWALLPVFWSTELCRFRQPFSPVRPVRPGKADGRNGERLINYSEPYSFLKLTFNKSEIDSFIMQ